MQLLRRQILSHVLLSSALFLVTVTAATAVPAVTECVHHCVTYVKSTQSFGDRGDETAQVHHRLTT